MNYGKGKGKGEKVKGQLSRRRAFPSVLVPLTFSLLQFPLSPVFAQPSSVTQNRIEPIAVREVTVRFSHLTVAEGLSQTTIYAIYQDRHGFMWFATQDGLNRFDGIDMKVYRHVPFDTTTIGDNTVASITEDHEGYYWIGSGRGLYRLDPATDRFTTFRHDASDPGSLGNDRVRHVLEDRDGRIWIATGDGLDYYDRETRRFTHFRNDPDDSTSISHNGVSWIYEDLAGRLWITAANGLNRAKEDLSGFDRFLVASSGQGDINLTEYRVQRILERPEEPGILWLATTSGLVRFDPETRAANTYSPTSEPALLRVADIAQDPIARNVLWLPVPGAGLGRFDIRTERFTIYGSDPTDNRSLSTTNTERVFVDRSGMVWVGVNGVGVDRFNPATVGMSHFRHIPGNDQSLPGAHVRGIFQANDGGLWLGTTDRQGEARLTHYDPVRRHFEHFKHDPNDPNSLSEGRIRAVLIDRDGYLWVGVGGTGLNRMSLARPGRFQHIRHDPDNEASLTHDVVRYLLEDHSGTIWAATNNGLDRVLSADDGTFIHYKHDPNDPNTLTGAGTSSLFESRSGAIWVGADGGLNRLDPLTGKVTRYEHNDNDPNTLAVDAVLAIHERSREPGVIWIGTFGGGLSRLDVASGTFKDYLEEDGLPNNTVYGILEDDQGRLWMSTNVGLARFDPETEAFRTYGLDAGLQSLEYNSVAFHKGPFGEMFFGGVNGLNAFFPDELTENATPPEVAIVNVTVEHTSVKDLPGMTAGHEVPDLETIRLPHDRSDVTFDYVALHFQNPAQNRYAYRLDGYDDDWIDAGDRRTASYTNLPPGSYTFRVKAANSDGVWNETGASVQVLIDPPWWKTWWAMVLYAVIALGFIAGIHRLQTNRVMRAERERNRQRELEDARTIEDAYHHLKDAQEQLIQAEKMASLGSLTAGIAHEIKNPLNFVNNFSQLTRDAVDDLANEIEKHRGEIPDGLADELDATIKTIRFNTERVQEHGGRADSVLKNMLRHSLSSKSERHPADLNGLLADYARLVQRTYEAKYPDLAVEVTSDFDKSVGRINIVPQDMGRVFTNLLDNAFQSLRDRKADEGPTFEPAIRLSTRRESGSILVRIEDNGVGVEASIRDKIFTPFFTTREVGAGAGLGLSMSYEIVAAHGGALELDGKTQEGATFVVRLPA